MDVVACLCLVLTHSLPYWTRSPVRRLICPVFLCRAYRIGWRAALARHRRPPDWPAPCQRVLPLLQRDNLKIMKMNWCTAVSIFVNTRDCPIIIYYSVNMEKLSRLAILDRDFLDRDFLSGKVITGIGLFLSNPMKHSF